jgi:hypothetical protein
MWGGSVVVRRSSSGVFVYRILRGFERSKCSHDSAGPPRNVDRKRVVNHTPTVWLEPAPSDVDAIPDANPDWQAPSAYRFGYVDVACRRRTMGTSEKDG